MTVTFFATRDGNGLVNFDLIKMAASFKLSCLVKKRKPPVNFPLFEWRDISIKEHLGSGTFGSVCLVSYEKEEQNVIV